VDKNERSYTSAPHICLYDGNRDEFTFTFYKLPEHVPWIGDENKYRYLEGKFRSTSLCM
jgi:hypothetical protein